MNEKPDKNPVAKCTIVNGSNKCYAETGPNEREMERVK
jgi:hypothetical protein